MQKQWFLGDLRRLLFPIKHMLRYNLLDQWPHLYANVGGWMPERLYTVLYAASGLFLVGAVFSPGWAGAPDWLWAGGMFGLAFITFAVMVLTLCFAFGTRESNWAIGLVGRYLTVVVCGLGAAVAEICHRGLAGARRVEFWLGLIGNGTCLAAILFSIGARVI